MNIIFFSHYTVPSPDIYLGEQNRVEYRTDHSFAKVVCALFVILVSVGLIYLAYSLFVKDCILLFKAKRQKTTTEIGFGQTPAHTEPSA
jgi:hypothetical protein